MSTICGGSGNYDDEKWEETAVVYLDGSVGEKWEVSFSSQHPFLKSMCTQCSVVIY
jgi:hypothetical protein